MTARKTKAKPKPKAWNIELKDGERPSAVMARKLNAPYNRHGLTICQFQKPFMDALPEEHRPDMVDFAEDMKARGEAMAGGDLSLANHLLASQAMTLDAIFTDYARRSAINAVEHLDASERYMRLALKAQAGSRATLAELVKLHQPREQTVRHVHVNEGGQAVIADQFHHHTGGQENAKPAERPHAQGSCGPAMLGHDAQGNGVPIPGDQGEAKVQDARRQRKWRATGQS